MLFNSVEFMVFLPVVFLLYWFGCTSGRRKNYLLIAASYVFYAWWDWRFLALIIGVTVVAYFAGIGIERSGDRRWHRKAILAVELAVSVGALVLFKYFNFFSQSFVRVLEAVGFTPDVPTLDLILPVGISFYTFQALGYCIDVFRRRIDASRDAAAFFVFISFFPQLVAGPIERASNLLPQFERDRRRFSYKRGVGGMELILWGLFKKMVVADNAAKFVNIIFADRLSVGTLNLWIGALLFAFQIYGDFSGYSDIAIGSARLFGIDLCRNFNLPYFSKNIHEFWRRWHISLTSWFRDYVYIPLGGNRHGKFKTARNTIAVFLVSGLWHGAAFTYLLWGAWHGILMLPRIVAGKKAGGRKGGIFKSALGMGLTFLLVMVGWVIFRAESVGDAFGYIGAMFGAYVPAPAIIGKVALVWVVVLVMLEFLSRGKETPLAYSPKGIWSRRWVRWAGCVVMLLATLLFAGQSQEFIYFKF